MANTYRTVNLSAGAGIDDKKIKVSIDDKQHEFIEQKLLSGSPRVNITVQNPGLIEKLLVDIDETQIDHNNLLNYDINEHRPLDDISTSLESLWSSQKIKDELDLKIDTVPSTDNAIVKFDGTTGQVQDSGIIIDDQNNITVPGNLNVNGTLTYLNTDILEVSDPNITINKNGTQSTANSQKSGITIEMSDATNVVLGYDSSLSSKMSLGEIGSESEIITSYHTQTLYNKTIDFDPSGSTLSSSTVSDALKELDQDKANTILDNLQPNPSGTYNLYSDLTFDQDNSAVVIRSKGYVSGERSNNLIVFSGSTGSADSGNLQVISGNIFEENNANSGGAWFGTGQIVDPLNPGNSGYAALSSGSVQSGTSGDVYIFSGLAYNGGNRGRVEIDAPVIDMISGQLNVRDGNINLLDSTSSVSNRIVNLQNPIDEQDAATKFFVEESINNIIPSSIITTDGIQGGGSLESDLLITLALNELDEQTGLDRELDYMVVYDESVDEHKKIKIKDVAKIGSSKGDISEGSISLLQSQTLSNITGLVFDPLVVRSFVANISVQIDATVDLYEQFTIQAINTGSDWEYTIESQGDESSINFIVDTSGQIKYNSSTYVGFVEGFIKFRATTTSV